VHVTFDPQDFEAGWLNMPHKQKLVGHEGREEVILDTVSFTTLSEMIT